MHPLDRHDPMNRTRQVADASQWRSRRLVRALATKRAALAIGLALVCGLVPVRASASFSQGFETDTSGWFPNDGTANREANGYVSPVPYASGIASAAGTDHARLRRETCETESTGGGPAVLCSGAFTRWGGYNKDWTGGYTTQ